jgi:hypothetical protein
VRLSGAPNLEFYNTFSLSSRPERTRISCHAALETSACAAFRKESRMKLAYATNINRKSGVASRRDLRFGGPVEMFFDRTWKPQVGMTKREMAVYL